ncbi:unnamed protein product [Moneuplotes crassus]|uniref:Uncharacterized protein n=1 Tax=Euplotes crassus TaxID=5936 RepID=A0AAD1Y354_EUPCR|nr:unnamed protein product [Moneuplotes crassus]
MEELEKEMRQHGDLTIKLLKQYQTVQKPEFLNSPLDLKKLIKDHIPKNLSLSQDDSPTKLPKKGTLPEKVFRADKDEDLSSASEVSISAVKKPRNKSENKIDKENQNLNQYLDKSSKALHDENRTQALKIMKLEQIISQLNIRVSRLKDRNKYLESKDSKTRQAKNYEVRTFQKNVEAKLKEKYDNIMKENLVIFEEEVKEIKSQFFNMRMSTISKDNMIKKLINILAKQERYMIEYKNAIVPKLSFNSLAAALRRSKPMSPKAGANIPRMNSLTANDTLSDRANLAAYGNAKLQLREDFSDQIMREVEERYTNMYKSQAAEDFENAIIKNYRKENIFLKHDISTLKDINKNHLVEIDKQIDMIKEIRDLAAIEKGELLRDINKEYDTQLLKIKTKMTEDADKYSRYKKYTSAELKLLKNINERLKNYIQVLKKELVYAKTVIKDPKKLKDLSKLMNYEPYEIRNKFDKDLNKFNIMSKATLQPEVKRRQVFSRANPRSRGHSVKPHTRDGFRFKNKKFVFEGNTILSDTDISLKMLESKPMTPPSNMIRNIRTVYQNLGKKSDTKA